MKKVLLPLLLVSSLYAEQCWSTDKSNWIQFDWLNKPTLLSNGVDDELSPLEIFPIAKGKWGCTHIKEYQMNILTLTDIKVIKSTLKESSELGIEQRAYEIIVFIESPQNPQEIIGVIQIEDFDEIFEEVYGV